jgi:hypothetical protein
MQFQMEEAVNLEDFEKAGRIKKKLAAVIAQDPVAGVIGDFKVQNFTTCYLLRSSFDISLRNLSFFAFILTQQRVKLRNEIVVIDHITNALMY